VFQPRTIFLLLGAAIIVLFLGWLRTRERRWLQMLCGAVAALGVLGLVIWLRPETPHAQVVRKTREMAASALLKDVEGVMRHVSDDFTSGGGDKATLRALVKALSDGGQLKKLVVYDFEGFDPRKPPAGDRLIGTLEFKSKVETDQWSTETFVRVTATYQHDADGEWRLKELLIRPATGNTPYNLNGMPLP